MDGVVNDTSLLLFRFSGKVMEMKKMAQQQWPEIPADAMAFFGGEVLASGVVLWAMINATGLDAMRWPGDLPVILGLKMGVDSAWKIGDVLGLVADGAGFVGAQVDQMHTTFLELLQWKVVDQLHASLFVDQRRELAGVLASGNFAKADRSVVLYEMGQFLQKNKVDAYTAEGFFKRALEESLLETFEEFKVIINPEAKEKIAKLIG